MFCASFCTSWSRLNWMEPVFPQVRYKKKYCDWVSVNWLTNKQKAVNNPVWLKLSVRQIAASSHLDHFCFVFPKILKFSLNTPSCELIIFCIEGRHHKKNNHDKMSWMLCGNWTTQDEDLTGVFWKTHLFVTQGVAGHRRQTHRIAMDGGSCNFYPYHFMIMLCVTVF